MSNKFDGRSMTCFNPDKLHSWVTGGWVFDANKQELRFTHYNRISSAARSAGTITKTFSVGLKGGKLFLYNCRKGGVETGETALEYQRQYSPPPIDLTR
jgi:hypothetical protein